LQVVLMNQVTTKLAPSGGSSSGGDAAEEAASRLVPALGDSWAHAATSRVILHWQGSSRHAFIYKSPTQPAAGAQYRVTKEGVRGVDKRSGKRARAGG
jgi:RAD51-like protein 2